MNPTVVIAGSDLVRLVGLAVGLGATGAPTMIETPDPVARLTTRPLHFGDAAVLLLTGRENIGDLLAMFKANAGVRSVLLSPACPPHAAVARVVAQHNGAVLPATESPVVIAATLIALLSNHGTLAL
jgi:hypothetical protein